MTGAGKSSLANTLFWRQNEFTVGSGSKSCTKSTIIKKNCWKNSTDELICVDTPGHNDTEGKDSENIEEMVETLKKEIKEVSAIMIV